MKNIHVLPTDKPSRLYSDKGKLWLDDLVYADNNQHIYITSDEEIKEGDYFLLKNNIHKVSNSSLNNPLNPMPNYFQKIILTTDQDLIKDGVQFIDDDFLEWFVKNPSCESVEVTSERRNWKEINYVIIYKIIIPQEEPKQETLEEVAREYWKRGQFGLEKAADTERAFLRGGLWQQERSYSEEEVLEILYKHTEDLLAGKKLTLEEWFEQFKNK